MGDRRPTRGINPRVREAVGCSRDPLYDTELLSLLTRGKPNDLKRIAELLGQEDLQPSGRKPSARRNF